MATSLRFVNKIFSLLFLSLPRRFDELARRLLRHFLIVAEAQRIGAASLRQGAQFRRVLVQRGEISSMT